MTFFVPSESDDSILSPGLSQHHGSFLSIFHDPIFFLLSRLFKGKLSDKTEKFRKSLVY